MFSFFESPLNVLHVSSRVLWLGLGLLLVGITGAYGLDAHFNLPTLVSLHALVIIGPTLLKLGYVLRLVAQHQLRSPQAKMA
jgi:multidrug transporter EmrE-like cation transporter